MKEFQLQLPINPTEKVVVRKIQQWGGLAFAVGNVLFLVNKLDEMSRLFLSRPMPDVISGQNPGLILLGQAAVIIGYVSYYQFYASRTGQLGKYILRLFCGGGILLAIGHVTFMTDLDNYLPASIASYREPMFFLVIIGLLLLLIGLISFGILALRRRVLARWRGLPLVTGLMGFIGFFLFSGEDINSTFLAFRTLFAIGLIGLGLALWMEEPLQRDHAS